MLPAFYPRGQVGCGGQDLNGEVEGFMGAHNPYMVGI